MLALFKSGEMCSCTYADELSDGSMFLTLADKTFIQAATFLGSVDLSEIKVQRIKMNSEVQEKVYTGYTNIEYITTEGANARARLRRSKTT